MHVYHPSKRRLPTPTGSVLSKVSKSSLRVANLGSEAAMQQQLDEVDGDLGTWTRCLGRCRGRGDSWEMMLNVIEGV